jgi:hypothetical protein
MSKLIQVEGIENKDERVFVYISKVLFLFPEGGELGYI